MTVTITRLAGLAVAIACPSWIAAVRAQPPAVELRPTYAVAQSCEEQVEAGDIVVCARRRDDERYRLPLRDLESPAIGAATAFGDIPRASADPAWPAACGIYEGQRRCNRREMAEFGYFGGRNPAAAFSTLADTLDEPK